mgnify:CR=1 FL=1
MSLDTLITYNLLSPAPAPADDGACALVLMGGGARTAYQAGALQAMGIEKMQRAQDIALENKLPFINLGESAGANLLKYKVEHFILGGGNFYRLAKLSAAGLPVINVLHGSSTAGGAYIPGLSDVVIMVRERARAFLAGPPLLKAATGEIATDEELGGADMHCSVSGLGDYLADDSGLGFAGGAVHDPLTSLLLCASPQAAYTVVNGRVVVREGRLVTVDLGPLVERHNRLALELARAAATVSRIAASPVADVLAEPLR